MSQRESQNSAEEHLLPIDGPPPADPHPATTPMTNQPGRPFLRFWRRSLVLIFFPLGTTAYYFAIWRCFGRDPDDPVKYGNAIEIWIFYSWFVIGVFALEWSKYGLVGVESAMLQTSFWQAPNTVALMMHSDSMWSGPDGWFKGLKWLLSPKKRIHRLWCILASLSFLPYVAFPLSSLSFEPSDGYVPTSSPAMVIGHTLDDFHRRQESYYYSGALSGWQIGSSPTAPGFGVIYTPDYLQRSHYSGFQHVPNVLPLTEGIPEMFLPPQSSAPISGQAWGLHAGYNCSMAKDYSEFTILSQKSSSSYFYGQNNTDELSWIRLNTKSNETIYAFSSSSSTASSNTWGYAEMGIRGEIGTYDGSEPGSFDRDGISKADIFEYLLWQARLENFYSNNYSDFNSTLDPVVAGLGHPIIQAPNRTFLANDTFLKFHDSDTHKKEYESLFSYLSFDNIISLAPPIGIRCRAISTLGTADLNPWSSTFRSFKQTQSPPINASLEDTPTPRLGGIAHKTMLGRYAQIFTSASSPAPITMSNSYIYRSYIQPQMLQRSIMLAYAMDVLQLMYDGTYGFGGAWNNTNLTSSKPGRVLVNGKIPQCPIASILAVWALGSTLLGIIYGFRRRWSNSLDGYSFFRFGVELADEVKERPDFLNAREFHDSKTLRSLPGLTGDMRNGSVGQDSVELDDMATK